MKCSSSITLHQITLGLCTFLFSLVHAFITFLDADKLHPFTRYGWNTEQYQLAFLFGIFGVLLLVSIRSRPASTAISLVFALLCILLFMRYFWPSLALVTLFSLSNAFLTHLNPSGLRSARWWVESLVIAALVVFSASFFMLSFISRGN